MPNQLHFWGMIILMIVFSYLLTSNNVMLTFRNGVYNHLNKAYMALLMGVVMALIFYILLLFQGHFSKWLVITTILVIILVILIRQQTRVNDEQFLKGMIEHHDMALLMSDRIKEKTNKNNIYRFADWIIERQQEEIDYIKYLLETGSDITYEQYQKEISRRRLSESST